MLRLRAAALDALTRSGAALEEAEAAWHAVLAYVIGSIELDAATDPAENAFEGGLEPVLRGTIGV